jgi:hypothetical protein
MTEQQINKIMKLVGRVVINCADLAEEKADVATLSARIAAVESALRAAISPQASQAARPSASPEAKAAQA